MQQMKKRRRTSGRVEIAAICGIGEPMRRFALCVVESEGTRALDRRRTAARVPQRDFRRDSVGASGTARGM